VRSLSKTYFPGTDKLSLQLTGVLGLALAAIANQAKIVKQLMLRRLLKYLKSLIALTFPILLLFKPVLT
jgi:hypothetical protein